MSARKSYAGELKAKKSRPRGPTGDTHLLLSIASFCSLAEISRAMFYKLDAQGLAPKTVQVGAKRMIRPADAAEWRDSRPTTVRKDDSDAQ